jgi:hypothetical protein
MTQERKDLESQEWRKEPPEYLIYLNCLGRTLARDRARSESRDTSDGEGKGGGGWCRNRGGRTFGSA